MKPRKCLRDCLAVSAMLMLAAAGDAFAQAENANCSADVAKFCTHVQPGAGRVTQCLKESEWQLSGACREHAEAVSMRMNETLQACKDEVLQYCSSAEVDGGRIAQCLNRENPRLSPECKTLAKLLQKQ